MLAHRDPRRVAVVALGTGITATACAAHAPDVLDVFELEGEVAPASAAFASVAGGLPPTARLRVVDGRYGLLRSQGRYDVITTDPVHPAAAGSAELYTVEHYRLVASRLADDGVACQWLPLYELSTDDVRMVLRTFASVFRTAVFVAGPDLVILGRRGPWSLDADAIEARITGPVAGSLRPFGLASPGRLLGLLLADPDRTEFLAGDGLWNTDDRPVLEFASARSQYTGSSTENLAWLAFAPSAPAALLAREPRDAAAFAAGVERSRRLRRAMARWMEGGAAGLSRALAAFADLAEEDPADALSATMRDEVRGLLARDAASRGETEEAAALAREVLASPAAQDRQRLEAAEVLRDVGRTGEARAAATDLLPRLPRSERARRLAGTAR
jgi:spermidine synthase